MFIVIPWNSLIKREQKETFVNPATPGRWITLLFYSFEIASEFFFTENTSPFPKRTRLIRYDEGLTLETSALKLFTVANLRYQHSW